MNGVRGGGGRRLGGRRGAWLGPRGIAAAQRVGQIGVQLIRADAQVGVHAGLGQHAGLRDEHGDVVAQAGLVAVHRQVIGGFDRFAGLALLRPFLIQQTQTVQRIGHLVHGVQYGLVVVRDGQIGVGAAARQVGVQFAAVEDGQRDGRTEAGS
ncbi:hypothetical protein G6F68_011442 [Rhizopus microsporus]|nr:hypothetical protein G6F68_011442 [Rhizopus microsporus]